jgi:PAS domain S-box-containing protein
MSHRSAVGFTEDELDVGTSLRTVLEHVAQPVWVVDHEGLIRFANPAAVAALGYDDLSELLGKPSHQTIHYKYPDGSHFPVEDCPMLLPRTTGETIHSEEDCFVRRDGSMFAVAYSSAPIEMSTGRGAVVAFTDIDERRRIDQILRERDAILENVAQPVFVADHDGMIRYANAAAVEALGFADAAELVGQSGHWLVHYKRPDGSHFPIEECQFTRPRELGQPLLVGEDWFVRRDGSMVPLSYTAAPIDQPDGVGTVIAFEDIRERLEAERAARDRDVAEARAAEARAAQRRVIEAADSARRQLARDLHDGVQQHLVNGIIHLQLAQQRIDSDLQRAKGSLDAGVEQAKQGMDDLRALAAGIHPAILTNRGLAAALQALTAQMPLPVQLEVEVGDLAPSTEASVYFFCSEALTNIVKHAHATQASVSIRADGPRLTVEVADDGVGGADRDAGGTGLAGLADRVEALEGEFRLASNASGTKICAEIPLDLNP